MQTESKSVIIMLATYNGDKYLEEQLDSIIANSYPDLKLIISDDGSTDKTATILKQYEMRYSCIRVIKNLTSQHGAFYNFANLISYVKNENIKADYYMFSDQDDIWKHNKIEISVQEIEKHDRDEALLVYSSKEYVDEKLNPIPFNVPKENIFDFNILHQNKTFGCTYIFNNSLLDKLTLNAPDFFINYDHYVAFQAFLYGQVVYLPKKTILYRQHGDNVSGVVNKGFREKITFQKKYENNIALYKNLVSYMHKSSDFIEKRERFYIERLSSAKNNKIHFIFFSLMLGMHKNTIMGTIQFYLSMLLSASYRKQCI